VDGGSAFDGGGGGGSAFDSHPHIGFHASVVLSYLHLRVTELSKEGCELGLK
jgi:hypothetical protein